MQFSPAQCVCLHLDEGLVLKVYQSEGKTRHKFITYLFPSLQPPPPFSYFNLSSSRLYSWIDLHLYNCKHKFFFFFFLEKILFKASEAVSAWYTVTESIRSFQ